MLWQIFLISVSAMCGVVRLVCGGGGGFCCSLLCCETLCVEYCTFLYVIECFIVLCENICGYVLCEKLGSRTYSCVSCRLCFHCICVIYDICVYICDMSVQKLCHDQPLALIAMLPDSDESA